MTSPVLVRLTAAFESSRAMPKSRMTGCPAGPFDTMLIWTDQLGAPPVENVVVVDGQARSIEFFDGSVTLVAQVDPPYVRGDCNDDTILNIGDAVFILNALFQGGLPIPCVDPCDANSDGRVDQSDAIYILNYRFLGGPPPASPFPDCGDLGENCESYQSCG